MMESWRRPSRLMDILMQSYLSGDCLGYDAMDGNGDLNGTFVLGAWQKFQTVNLA